MSAIIEAAARALRSVGAPHVVHARTYIEAVLTAVTPLIRAAALEEAAKVLDAEADAYRKTGLVPELANAMGRLTAAISALKEQP